MYPNIFNILLYWLSFSLPCLLLYFVRETEERPGWCPDPHLPPCAGYTFLPQIYISSYYLFEMLRDILCLLCYLLFCRFVEIMAPVFSREAWRCVWHMIQVQRMTLTWENVVGASISACIKCNLCLPNSNCLLYGLVEWLSSWMGSRLCCSKMCWGWPPTRVYLWLWVGLIHTNWNPSFW